LRRVEGETCLKDDDEFKFRIFSIYSEIGVARGLACTVLCKEEKILV
jgi:hypothetical protein